MSEWQPVCELCNGFGWVCENHPDKPMLHDNCLAAGDPCPICNINYEHRFDDVIAKIE